MMGLLKRSLLVGAAVCSLCWASAAGAVMTEAPASAAYSRYDGRGAVVPFGPDRSHLRRHALRSAGSFPSKFDLRELGAVTPAKEQKHNDCWTYAALGSAESIFKRRTGIELDLSELHLAWFAANTAPGFGISLSTGGNDNIAAATLARWIGPVAESAAPSTGSSLSGRYSDYRALLHLEHAYFLALEHEEGYDKSDMDRRKALLMEHGALSVGIRAAALDSSAYCRADTAAAYNDEWKAPDHAVTLCGWDDDFPIESFNPSRRPPRRGAWLVKNSRGRRAGRDGFFWVSYEDVSLCDGVAFIMGDPRNYDKLYEHDELGWSWSAGLSSGVDSAWMANVFTSGATEEELRAVSFYTTGNDAEYTVRAYTGLTDPSDPTSGTLAIELEGTMELAGYHTVDFGRSVTLAPGTRFSVAVFVKTPGYSYPVPMEVGLRDVRFYQNARAAAGESFVSSDGGSWAPAEVERDGERLAVNVCVKAFAWTPSGRDQEEQREGGGGGGGCAVGSAALFALITISTRRGRR